MIVAELETLTIPISFVRCPVHLSLVAKDGEGHFIGKCDGCAGESADGLIWMRRNPLLPAAQFITNTTDPGRSIVGESAAGVRGESL